MLAEELKPPKRERNSWHNWVEQKKKKWEREKESGKHKQVEEAQKPFSFKTKDNSPKAVNNETEFYSLTDTEFKREIVKILKELRLNIKELKEDINGNAD